MTPQSPSLVDPEAVLILSEHAENEHAARADDEDHDRGSSIAGAVFNFTNSIVGAGAIGLGGAMALSGGLISVFLILFFGLLTKLSLDLVVRLSVETDGAHGSYEDLARVGLGKCGRWIVLFSKIVYSFGCLVAYIVVIKDNFGPALRNLIYGDDGDDDDSKNHSLLYRVLSDGALFTWAVSLVCILPLCLLRDITPLASFSILSVVAMVSIVGIVIYMYFFCPDIGQSGGSVYENWLEVRPGVWESMGTFVFTYVSQHTVHLVYGSLKPSLRTVSNWKRVSTYSLLAATMVSLSVGVFVYMTFWQATKSDIFQIYPSSWKIDLAKLLLSITMVLTFPLPFFTCRELLIVMFVHPFCGIGRDYDSEGSNSLEEPLLSAEDRAEQQGWDVVSTATDLSRILFETATPQKWLLPDNDRQLQLPGHALLTIKLWFLATGLAISSPNLGDVLNLVGCATGTVIAFLLPALLALKLEGYSTLAGSLLVVGVTVGTAGTFFSVKKLLIDLKA